MTTVTYSNWNTDMDRAPKGKTVTVDRIVASKKNPGAEAVRVTEEFVPDHVILMSECGKVIKSYWLPKENRWAGFSVTSRPLAWMDWPTWCEEVAADVLEQRAILSSLIHPSERASA